MLLGLRVLVVMGDENRMMVVLQKVLIVGQKYNSLERLGYLTMNKPNRKWLYDI